MQISLLVFSYIPQQKYLLLGEGDIMDVIGLICLWK